jgi:hypothetical protein
MAFLIREYRCFPLGRRGRQTQIGQAQHPPSGTRTRMREVARGRDLVCFAAVARVRS